MEFKRIFGNSTDCSLWAVCYAEHRSGKRNCDVFEKLFSLWFDTQYLQGYFIQHQHRLSTPFWRGMSVSQAIDKVQDEADDFYGELKNIETNETTDKAACLRNIFESLHREGYVLLPGYDRHRKGKPDANPPMLRIYAALLDDGTYIITGGGIKLTGQMGDELEDEVTKIISLQRFLQAEQIVDREGLKDFEVR